MRVKCLVQEHNTMSDSLVGAQTWTTLAVRVKHTNSEATVPTINIYHRSVNMNLIASAY